MCGHGIGGRNEPLRENGKPADRGATGDDQGHTGQPADRGASGGGDGMEPQTLSQDAELLWNTTPVKSSLTVFSPAQHSVAGG